MSGTIDTFSATAHGGSTANDVLWPGQWHGALRRYLVAIALGNLIWEFLQMPLYTIWRTGKWSEIVFAAIHCTGGDILIALSSLTIALLLVGNGRWPSDRFRAVAVLTMIFGVTYTLFSEWLNIVIRAAWAYSELMPTVSLIGLEVGLSPLLQWVAIPAATFIWIHHDFAGHGRSTPLRRPS